MSLILGDCEMNVKRIVSLIVTMLCTLSFGATFQFKNWGNDDLWTTYNNWFGTVTSADGAYIAETVRPEKNGLYCLIDDTVTAQCSLLGIGSWNRPAEPNNIPTINITGGSLTVTNDFTMGYEGHYHGNMIMSGGVLNVGRDWYIGRGYNGNATITGGVINITRGLHIGRDGQTAKGRLNIYGGTVNVGYWWVSVNSNSATGESLGLIDITNGTLTIPDSATETAMDRINGYVTAGKVIAFGGDGVVKVEHDDVNQLTIVTAMPILTADFNDDGIVDFKDFAILAGQWLEESAETLSADFDGNGIVDFEDLKVSTSQWLMTSQQD